MKKFKTTGFIDIGRESKRGFSGSGAVGSKTEVKRDGLICHLNTLTISYPYNKNKYDQ